MASLTFDGFDVDRNAILYRGGLGAQYSFSPDGAAATFKFPHGSRIRMRRGPFASRSSLVVIGVTTAERHELVVHDEEGGVAHILAQCFTFNDLCEKHDPAPVAAHEAFPKAYVEMAGPLEYRYAFNTDSVVLDPKYGVSSGTRLHIGSLKSDATVVGEFLSVLWVTLTSRESAGAVPLIGCTNEATLLNLHNVRDSDAATGSISPRTPRTPGRARGSGAAPFSVDETRQVATCVGAFGAHLEVAIDDASLAPFGVVHKSRIVATKGLDVGKGFTVVGVKSGSLYILGDGDRKVTCCRNCATKADLEKLYGFEPAGRGRSISRGSEPQVIPAPRLPYTTSPAVPLPDANAPEAPPLRSSSTLKNCWTSHGRQAFDISPAACGVFGFAHGQTVVATVGGESGKRFHVFGVRHGVLWVVPEGAEYATPLRHCTTKTEVDQAFGFVGNGKCDLSWLYEAPKPMGTPVSSPRRGDTAPNSPEQPVPSPLVGAREDPTDIAAPPAVVVSVPRALAPAPPKVIIPKLPISVVDQRQPSNEPVYTVAPDASSAVLPASVPSRDRSVDTEAFRIGAMPVTRHFLKAYALFKLRLPSEAVDPQAFHGFYAEAPQQRLNAAMSALASAESQWRLFEEKKRKCTFSNATVDEMIEALNRAPHICP